MDGTPREQSLLGMFIKTINIKCISHTIMCFKCQRTRRWKTEQETPTVAQWAFGNVIYDRSYRIIIESSNSRVREVVLCKVQTLDILYKVDFLLSVFANLISINWSSFLFINASYIYQVNNSNSKHIVSGNFQSLNTNILITSPNVSIS